MPVAPRPSVTRSLTACGPTVANVVVCWAPVFSKVPSPSRSHSYLVMPSASLEVAPLKVTVWPGTAAVALATMRAAGA